MHIFLRLITTWHTHLRKLMGHAAQGVVHRQIARVFPSPHTQLSVGLEWTCSCVLGCPSNVCLNRPCQLASSHSWGVGILSCLCATAALLPVVACSTDMRTTAELLVSRALATRIFTASVDVKISFTTNTQTKFEHTTGACGIETYHVFILGCKDNSLGR